MLGLLLLNSIGDVLIDVCLRSVLVDEISEVFVGQVLDPRTELHASLLHVLGGDDREIWHRRPLQLHPRLHLHLSRVYGGHSRLRILWHLAVELRMEDGSGRWLSLLSASGNETRVSAGIVVVIEPLESDGSVDSESWHRTGIVRQPRLQLTPSLDLIGKASRAVVGLPHVGRDQLLIHLRQCEGRQPVA